MKWLILFSFFSIFAPQPQNFEAAQNLAKEKNIPLLLVFSGSDWCRPCIHFEKDVLENDQFLSFAKDSLIVFKADFPRNTKTLTSEEISQNQQLAEQYNKNGAFPYLVLFAPDANISKEKPGAFGTVSELKAWINY